MSKSKNVQKELIARSHGIFMYDLGHLNIVLGILVSEITEERQGARTKGVVCKI